MSSFPFLLLVLLALPSALSRRIHLPTTVSVLDHGAAGDGRTYDTAAIQSAIDACASGGGGRVLFPSGRDYLTATVILHSGVTLEVESGARVLAGTREADYPPEQERWYLILAEGAVGAGITGGGEINGQGWAFVERRDPRKNVMVSWNTTGKCLGDECRPRLLGFLDSVDVRVWDIKLADPAYWWSIYRDAYHPSNCPSYRLNATTAIVLLRTYGTATVLLQCHNGQHYALFFASFIFTCHGGNVSDVKFSNINISTRYYDPSWWGRAEPIYITTCARHQTSKVGSIANLKFINISAVSENGIFLSGSDEGLISNLKFVNVNLTYKRWTNYAGDMLDYRPGCQELVHHNTAGMMMEHVSGAVLDNVMMRWYNDSSRGWNNPLLFRPSTVNKLSFHDWSTEAI